MHQTGGFERVTTGIELTGLDAGEDALEGLNIVVPLVFGAVIWFSIALMYPERGLLSLLAIIPTAIFISWVVWKRSKLNPAVPSQAWLPRWTSVLGNIGVGMFLEVIVLSIELLLLFVICVLGYSVAYTGVWDNSIHGFVDTWQEFSFFPPYFSLLPINVVLSVICSFGMFALFSEIIKYFIAQSLITFSRLPFKKFVTCTVAGVLGMCFIEAMAYIMISGEVLYALLQIGLVAPLHILTGIGIAIECALRTKSTFKTLAVPIMIHGAHRLQAYLVQLFIPDVILKITIYSGITLFLLMSYGSYVYLRSLKVPSNHWVEPEGLDQNLLDLQYGRFRMSAVHGQEESVDVSQLPCAAAAA
eukprot:TRINITY_DN694_c0_g2_i1.p1 TRINITY_DN694_c0_g2~~TRINITY_DN694_c0_g2_i1.p1  ORF type:complete len:359 (+),score=96.21 TRINITY_DN694_c0_g2_i1:1108-2184(+)